KSRKQFATRVRRVAGVGAYSRNPGLYTRGIGRKSGDEGDCQRVQSAKDGSVERLRGSARLRVQQRMRRSPSNTRSTRDSIIAALIESFPADAHIPQISPNGAEPASQMRLGSP